MARSIGDYGSHYPILAACVARTSGPVLELGCGDWSSPMLHYMCQGRYLVTAETDANWLSHFSNYACPRRHEFFCVKNWNDFSMIEALKWDVAFVDCAPGEARTPLIARLKGHAKFVVAHDSERDYNTGANYGYEKVTGLFKHVSEWRRFRPYTLILSDDEPFGIEECDKTWIP